jgi:hypothetical protein
MKILSTAIFILAYISCLSILSNDGLKKAQLKTTGFFGDPDKKRTLDVIIKTERPYDGKYTWEDYRLLLTELSKSRYKVLNMKDFATDRSNHKIVVGMRHDIDSHPEKALQMAEIEKDNNIPSTYFILHSAAYYGTVKNGVMNRNQGLDNLVKKLYKNGFEIGIHTDLFYMMWTYQYAPVSFIKEEIKYYDKLGIPVKGSVAHGSRNVLTKGVNNMLIFSEFGKKGSITVKDQIYTYGENSITDFGFDYEAYWLLRQKKAGQTGDIDRRFKGKSKIKEIIDYLAKLKSPSRIVILTHPEHWGKK